MKAYFAKSGIAAAVLGLAAIGTPAMAEQASGAIMVSKVSYADLVLSTERGMDKLRSRLNQAAREVCGMDIRQTGTFLASREARACYVDTRESFEREMAMLDDRRERKG